MHTSPPHSVLHLCYTLWTSSVYTYIVLCGDIEYYDSVQWIVTFILIFFVHLPIYLENIFSRILRVFYLYVVMQWVCWVGAHYLSLGLPSPSLLPPHITPSHRSWFPWQPFPPVWSNDTWNGMSTIYVYNICARLCLTCEIHQRCLYYLTADKPTQNIYKHCVTDASVMTF